jgi:ubiquinone/menaquinone biosynthesis C-methylase UbiE
MTPAPAPAQRPRQSPDSDPREAERAMPRPSHVDRPASSYIMEGAEETERLRLKTEQVLVRRHLDWAGLLPGQSLVDFGCGSGDVILTAARHCKPIRVIGVDANEQRLADIRRRAEEEGLANVHVHAASISSPGTSGLPDAAYDHAWARFFLEYQPRPVTVVVEMARSVRPGGRITLIDVEGNGVWHYGMDTRLKVGLADVVADLARTGFDPHVGQRLPSVARSAGLSHVRHEIEPYHRIVGRPDERTMAAWRRRIDGLRANYLNRLFPDKTHLAWVFDAYLEFLERDDTMTWSLLHLVQGTVSPEGPV